MITKLRYADDAESNEFQLAIPAKLPYRRKKEAAFLKTIGKGVMLVTGKPGSGKDLFGASLAWMNKYYFGRRVLLDFLPKRAFGEYTLFNAQVMMREINKMAKSAGTDIDFGDENIHNGAKAQSQAKTMENLSKNWVEDNEIMLQGAVLYLNELKRYCYNRNPHNPFNKFIGSICTVWRHLDLLIIGTHVQKHEIDQYSFLEYVNHWAKCSWSFSRPDTTDVTITRGAFIGANGVFDIGAKPIVLHVNGEKPRDILGGKRYYDLYQTKSMVNLKPIVRQNL